MDEDNFKKSFTFPQLHAKVKKDTKSSAESGSQRSAMPHKFNNKTFESTNNE